MKRTITVIQPALTDSSLKLIEAGTPEGRFSFSGLLKRSARLYLGQQRLTYTTLGLPRLSARNYPATRQSPASSSDLRLLTQPAGQRHDTHT